MPRMFVNGAVVSVRTDVTMMSSFVEVMPGSVRLPIESKLRKSYVLVMSVWAAPMPKPGAKTGAVAPSARKCV
jgi:hypothetical protein